MKNKILLIVTLGTFILGACEKEKDLDYKSGASISVDAKKLTLFDFPATLGFTVSNSSVREVELSGMNIDGEKLSVSEGKASYILKASDLGDNYAIGSKLSFDVLASLGDYYARNSFEISLVSAFNISAPSKIKSATLSDTSLVKFSLKTYRGTMPNIVVEKKKNNEAFVKVIADDIDAEKNSYTFYEFGGNYNIGDSIEYKITATLDDAIIETKSLKIKVIDKGLGEFTRGVLSTEVGSDSLKIADETFIHFIADAGVSEITSSEIKFAKLDAEPSSFNNLVEKVDGETLTSSLKLIVNDVVGFKYKLDNVDYYGYLNVNSINTENSGSPVYIIEFAYLSVSKE